MKREDFINLILAQPGRIATATNTVLQLANEVESLRDALKDRESSLLLEGAIEGKNEAIRSAQLSEATKLERIALQLGEHQLASAKVQVAFCRDSMKALIESANFIASGGALPEGMVVPEFDIL